MPHDVRRQELLVVWKQPQTRQRYLIGRLWRDELGYHFCYEDRTPRSVKDAQRSGFRLLEAFPELGRVWTSNRLFPVFDRRLPRPWYQPRLQAAGIQSTDPMELLRVTGGRVATDTLELPEPIQSESKGSAVQEYSVRFPIAGWRYYNGEQAIEELSPGTRLRLELEPDNQHDPYAIRILAPSGIMLGYVPAVYAWYMDASVERGEYTAEVDEVGPSDDPQQRVTVRFRGLEHPLDQVHLVPEGIEKYVASLALR